MERAFLKRTADALSAAGFDAAVDGSYLVVAGCKFAAEESRNGKRVLFLGSSFKVSEDGEYNVAKAVGLVIAELPAKLKAKEAAALQRARNEQYVNNEAALRRMYSDRKKNGSHFVLTESVSICADHDGYLVSVKCRTLDEAKEVLRGFGVS